MVYLFEDKYDDVLSVLFRGAYPKSIQNKFIYTCGHTNLVKVAEVEILKDDVAVYVDMVPDNIACAGVYKDLRDLALKSKNKLLIFPIVCSEYYFISHLDSDTNLLMSKVNSDICLNKGDYRLSNLYMNGNKPCSSFEKFCKFIIKHDVPNCIRHSAICDNGAVNIEYANYYNLDCLCSNSVNKCGEGTLKQKSLLLLMKYDIVPSGTIPCNKTAINYAEAVNIHRKLVDEYNAFVDKYNTLGILDKYSKKQKKSLRIRYTY